MIWRHTKFRIYACKYSYQKNATYLDLTSPLACMFVRPYLLTYLLIYLFIYLLTYLLHDVESFLRS